MSLVVEYNLPSLVRSYISIKMLVVVKGAVFRWPISNLVADNLFALKFNLFTLYLCSIFHKRIFELRYLTSTKCYVGPTFHHVSFESIACVLLWKCCCYVFIRSVVFFLRESKHVRKLVVFMIRSLTLSSSFLPCVWDCIGEVELGNKKKLPASFVGNEVLMCLRQTSSMCSCTARKAVPWFNMFWMRLQRQCGHT